MSIRNKNDRCIYIQKAPIQKKIEENMTYSNVITHDARKMYQIFSLKQSKWLVENLIQAVQSSSCKK